MREPWLNSRVRACAIQLDKCSSRNCAVASFTYMNNHKSQCTHTHRVCFHVCGGGGGGRGVCARV